MVSEHEKSDYVPLNFGTVLETSLRYWIKNLKSYWVLFFIIQLMIVLVAYLAFFLSGGDILVAQIAGVLGAQIPFWLIISYFPSFLSIGLTVVLIVVLVLNIIVQAILAGMVTRHTVDYHAKLSPVLRESYDHTRNRFWSLIGAQILVTLIIAGIGIGVMFVIVAISFGLFFMMGYLGILVLAVGIVLMMILLLYVTVRLTVVIPAVILGEEGAIGSISRSWRLVGGNWWRTFGITIVIAIFTIVLGIPTALIGSLLLFGFFIPSLLMFSIIAFIIIGAVVTGLTTPLGITTSTMIYHDLMGRQYGPYEPGKPPRLHSYTECPVCNRPVTTSERFCGQCGRELTID